MRNRTLAVLIQGIRVLRPGRQRVIGVFFRFYKRTLQEINLFVQHARIASCSDISAGGQRQPQEVIRTVRPYASTGRWMPPMLHVPLYELSGCAEKQLFTQQSGLGINKRHRVLDLIAKTEGPTRLIKSTSPPDPASNILRKKPTVGKHMEGVVGR